MNISTTEKLEISGENREVSRVDGSTVYLSFVTVWKYDKMKEKVKFKLEVRKANIKKSLI